MSETQLACFRCEQQNTHFSTIEITQGGNLVPARWTKFFFSERFAFPKDRAMAGKTLEHGGDNALCITLWCEHCEYLTAYRIYEHEGFVFMEAS